MSIKDSSCDETLTAPRTNVRSFTCVISLVNNQSGSLSEGLAALITRVLPFSGMGDIVGPKHSVAGKTLAAHLAGVRFLAGVRPVVNFEALRGLQLLAAQRAKVFASLVVRPVTVSPDLVLLQHRLVLVDFIANVAFVLGLVLAGLLKPLVRRRIVVVETIVLLQAVYVVEDAIARVASLHRIVRRCMRNQSVLIGKILVANLARKFRISMTLPFVLLHIGHADTHEAALIAWHGPRRVPLLHVGVKHKLLGIILAASDALEGPMNTVRYPQMRDQSRNEVEFCLAELASLLATFEFLSEIKQVPVLHLQIVIIRPLAAIIDTHLHKA